MGETGGFGVPGENNNGRRVIDFCAERELWVCYTYVEHKSLHKYIRVSRGLDGMEVMCMIDLVLAGCESSERNGKRPL